MIINNRVDPANNIPQVVYSNGSLVKNVVYTMSGPKILLKLFRLSKIPIVDPTLLVLFNVSNEGI